MSVSFLNLLNVFSEIQKATVYAHSEELGTCTQEPDGNRTEGVSKQFYS